MKTITLKSIGAAACALFLCLNAGAWGQKGHDITCAIAQQHLSKKAQKQVGEIFGGKSLVYWSSWMDNASHTQQYAYTKTWHYMDIDADETYDNFEREEKGDVLTAIEALTKALKSGQLNAEQKEIDLRMLIHLVGDLHCPMHMGHKTDLGGNKTQVQFFRNGRNLHSVWDSEIIESAHKWSRNEWVEEIDRVSKNEFKAITAGTPFDWGRDTYEAAKEIYEKTPAGAKLSYDEVGYWTPVVERQLLYGGLRLAALLNEIFK